jgi:hypothetical protein
MALGSLGVMNEKALISCFDFEFFFLTIYGGNQQNGLPGTGLKCPVFAEPHLSRRKHIRIEHIPDLVQLALQNF